MKKTSTLIFAITVLLLTVIFTLQNVQVAQVKLLFLNTEASLSLILFITLAIGILSAIIILLPALFSLRSINHQLKREIASLTLQNDLSSANNKSKE
jgi:uncharacterized integral membrane protein